MRKNIDEKTIELRLMDYYCRNDFAVTNQVSFFRKRIDVVLRPKNDCSIWTIEIKKNNWREALRQASLNMMGCHRSYVAMWHEGSGGAVKNMDMFIQLGVGLIVVNKSFEPEIRVSATENCAINKYAFDGLMSNL